jgi:SAM-dependent methyltransferase
MMNKLFFFLTNNRFSNAILIFLKLDGWMTNKFGIYKRIRINKNLSLQEMAGFSNTPQINEVLYKTHNDLNDFIKQHIKEGDTILDIGCGAGAYLKDFYLKYNCTGIDVNIDMIERGKSDFPSVHFIYGNFLEYLFKNKFKLIYCISVIEFIPPGKLDSFFKKIADSLENGGYLYLNYPPALKKEDLYYPDLYYIEYTPNCIEKSIKKYFEIIKHEHAFDGRKFNDYDPKPYGNGERIFKNAYVITAKKNKIIV